MDRATMSCRIGKEGSQSERSIPKQQARARGGLAMRKQAHNIPGRARPIPGVKRSTLQRKCTCGSAAASGECDKCREEKAGLQRSGPAAAQREAVPGIVEEVLRSPGQPLGAETRAFMEPRFGHDFSKVRLHTDARAAESAQAVNAAAYTVGSDVVFGAGECAPETSKGSRLLAHELTHVVQQADGKAEAAQTAKALSEPLDPAEAEAERAAGSIGRGESVEVKQPPTAAVHTMNPLETAGLIGGVAAGISGIGLGIAALSGAFDSSKYVDCPTEWQTKIVTASKTAEAWISNAVTKVDSVLALGDKAEPYVLERLHKHFKIAPTQTKELNKVRSVLAAILGGFAEMKFQCDAKKTDPKSKVYGEVKGFLGIYQGYGRIHLYSDWYHEERMQAETIAHEMAHRYGGIGEDIVYLKDDMNTYYALSTDRALDNADTYAQFAKQIFNIGSSKAPDQKPAADKAQSPASFFEQADEGAPV